MKTKSDNYSVRTMGGSAEVLCSCALCALQQHIHNLENFTIGKITPSCGQIRKVNSKTCRYSYDNLWTSSKSKFKNLSTDRLRSRSGRRSQRRCETQAMLTCAVAYCCIARSGKLDRARSRLYRSQSLQVNMRLKALAEI